MPNIHEPPHHAFTGAGKLFSFLLCCWKSLLKNQACRDHAEGEKASRAQNDVSPNEIPGFFIPFPQHWLANPFDAGTKVFHSQRQVGSSLVPILVPATGCATFGHCHSPSNAVNVINPFCLLVYIIGNMALPLPSQQPLWVSDQTQLRTTCSQQRKYHFTTENKKKHNPIFVVQMLQPPAALPRTSALTQEMRLLSKHQSGAIYIYSLSKKDI